MLHFRRYLLFATVYLSIISGMYVIVIELTLVKCNRVTMP